MKHINQEKKISNFSELRNNYDLQNITKNNNSHLIS